MKNFLSKNLIILILVVLAVSVTGALVYTNPGFFNLEKKLEGKEVNINKQNVLSSEEIKEKVIKFINENILQGQATASLIEMGEESDLYRLKIKIGEDEFDTYVTKDGKCLFPQFIDLGQESTEEQGITIGNFSISSDDICQENGKPIVYFFGSQGCPHCTWEHPIIEKVAKSFGDLISFHSNIDSEADIDIFSKYSTGGVPTEVLGCKYYRVGSGESSGEEEETKILTALICKLTQNQPTNICGEVQGLIDQVQ